MKTNFFVALLCFTLCCTYTEAILSCPINFFGYDQDNWRAMGYGFVQGFHKNPGDQCNICESFGNDMAAINKAYIYVEEMRNMWVNFNDVVNQNIFTIIFNLITIFGMMFDLFIHMDSIFKNSLIMNLPVTLVVMISDVNNILTVKDNFFNKLTTLSVLTVTIPGAHCRSIGYRVGAMVRFVFGVSYD